jgi:outer membrane protein OmpA-like peptidoglycan-associated protein
MKASKTGAALLAALMFSTSAFAQEVKKDGVIVAKTDNGVDIRTGEGPLHVVLTADTKVKQDGIINKDAERSKLITGLIVRVEGDQQGDTLTASEIIYKDRDWRAAIAAKGATTEEFSKAAAERAELRNAIIEGQEYVVQAQTEVLFPVGSSAVSAAYKERLRALAQKAPSYGNYRISILGFADPSGDAAANERLSMKRAMAVSNYVRQTGLIEPARVLSPSAMGEGTAAPGEAAPASNESARRVLVRVVTPKTQLTQ